MGDRDEPRLEAERLRRTARMPASHESACAMPEHGAQPGVVLGTVARLGSLPLVLCVGRVSVRSLARAGNGTIQPVSGLPNGGRALSTANRGSDGLRHLHVRSDRASSQAGTPGRNVSRATPPLKSSVNTSRDFTPRKIRKMDFRPERLKSPHVKASSRMRAGVYVRTVPVSGPMSL